MAKFVSVKAFVRGVHDDSEPIYIKVDQITHFYERSLTIPDMHEPKRVVHCEINSRGWLTLDHSMAEFAEMLADIGRNRDARRMAKDIIANALSECCHCNVVPEQHRHNAIAILNRLEAEGIGVS